MVRDKFDVLQMTQNIVGPLDNGCVRLIQELDRQRCQEDQRNDMAEMPSSQSQIKPASERSAAHQTER